MTLYFHSGVRSTLLHIIQMKFWFEEFSEQIDQGNNNHNNNHNNNNNNNTHTHTQND
jgi:hypothetical protein